MQLKIPPGCEIIKTDDNQIRIKICNTKFWVIGEKNKKRKWNMYLVDPYTNYKELISKDNSTESFARFSSIVLKTPFPLEWRKKEPSNKQVKRYIKKITK